MSVPEVNAALYNHLKQASLSPPFRFSPNTSIQASSPAQTLAIGQQRQLKGPAKPVNMDSTLCLASSGVDVLH